MLPEPREMMQLTPGQALSYLHGVAVFCIMVLLFADLRARFIEEECQRSN